MLSRARAACVVAALLSAAGCGSRGEDEIPEALLTAIREGSEPGADYPPGPYGSAVGDVAQNVCIRGWRDPAGDDYAQSKLQTLCFSDFWDPGATTHSLLLVNTSALWCTACRSEYGGTESRPSLGSAVQQRTGRGLRLLGVLFQDAERNPATVENAALWATTFEVDFPFGYDEPFAMGAFADPILQPFNMLLDTRTMQIVFTLQGDDPETLWPAIDQRLMLP
jgi:hypothetical protein